MRRFTEAGFLVGNGVVDLVHESLISRWPRFVDWTAQEAREAELYRALARDAAAHARNERGLWRNPELGLARKWRDEAHPREEWAKRYGAGFAPAMAFLTSSEQAEARRTWVRRAILAGGVLAVVTVVAALGWSERVNKESAKRLQEKAERLAVGISTSATSDLKPKLAQSIDDPGSGEPASTTGADGGQANPAPSAVGCETYRGKRYTPGEWRSAFIREVVPNTWHVFVASVGSDETEADGIVRLLQRAHPNVDFQTMPTQNVAGGNSRWAIVIAQGLSSPEEARAIATCARECGISPDAFPQRQP